MRVTHARDLGAPPDLSLTFSALSDPSRREMVRLLRQGEMRVTEIAAPFKLSLNAVSKHIRALERAGIVHRRVRGRDHFIRLAPEPLHHAVDWLEEYREFWESRIDALDALLIAGTPDHPAPVDGDHGETAHRDSAHRDRRKRHT